MIDDIFESLFFLLMLLEEKVVFFFKLLFLNVLVVLVGRRGCLVNFVVIICFWEDDVNYLFVK